MLDATGKRKGPVFCPGTSGWWAIVSSDDMLTEVPINHRMALLDVWGTKRILVRLKKNQFELPVVEWRLRSWLRQEAADAISILEGLPESTHEPMFGLDLERQTLSFLDVFVRYAFHVIASHPMPVTQHVDQPRRPLHLTLLERPAGSLQWNERGIVPEPSHYGFCSPRELSVHVTLLGEQALDVIEGFTVRVLRFLVEMLDGFCSASTSALASPQFHGGGEVS